MADKKIVMYSTPTWPYCTKAKEYLSKNNIPFQEHNVAADRGAAKDMIEKTQQIGVPVIIIDDKDIVVGFDQPTLNKLLDIKS